MGHCHRWFHHYHAKHRSDLHSSPTGGGWMPLYLWKAVGKTFWGLRFVTDLVSINTFLRFRVRTANRFGENKMSNGVSAESLA
jgi:hypothetical protein